MAGKTQKREKRRERVKEGRDFLDGLRGANKDQARSDALHDRISSEIIEICSDAEGCDFSEAQLDALSDIAVYIVGMVDPDAGAPRSFRKKLKGVWDQLGAGGQIATVLALPVFALGIIELGEVAYAWFDPVESESLQVTTENTSD